MVGDVMSQSRDVTYDAKKHKSRKCDVVAVMYHLWRESASGHRSDSRSEMKLCTPHGGHLHLQLMRNSNHDAD